MSEVTCDTIACAAGWLALDPKMQAQGLRSTEKGEPFFDNRQRGYYGTGAMACFFAITYDDAWGLFRPRIGAERRNSGKTDRAIWLDRAYAFLANHNETVNT